MGIGASAGGLEALSRLLARISPRTGLCFVVVQHLDPDRPSQLPEILSRSTAMRVSAAVDGSPLVSNEVLVAPPHAFVGVRSGCLAIRKSPPATSPFLPIDAFFRAIADGFEDDAVGIVLSGTGSDGAAGVAAIRAAGGLTIAQAPESARFAAMPNAAIEAGVDLVLGPEEMADRLSEPRETPEGMSRRQDGPGDDPAPVLAVVKTLRDRDFTQYKRGTIERRILRRMALLNVATFEDYARHLGEHGAELDALCEDLLIKVTRFFREPEGFEQLTTLVFPRLVQEKGPGAPIRIWVPGCATGEEAFSIAICMTEFLASRNLARTVHVFATDVSREAIEKARAGRFGAEIEATVSPARLGQFFVASDGGYQIVKPIREMCIFAEQDVTRDPPFSRMDLVSCRNLLIYFEDSLQRRVLSTFHFALNPQGFLLLGNAESIGQASDLFAATGKGSRVFARRLVPSRAPDFAFGRAAARATREPPPASERKFTPADVLRSEVDHAIAESVALDGVVVDEHMEILQFRGHTEPFLAHRPGESASFGLFKMARDGLLVDLRLAIFEAQATGLPVRRDHLRIARHEDATTFEAAIQVLPFRAQSTGQNYFVVLFEKVVGADRPTPGDHPPDAARTPVSTATTLQRELAETKRYLNSLIEKEQASNEALKTASEEILSSNEELQSTNEELQTAKQEAEAANEELTTVNDELRHRAGELARAHGDLANLVSAAQASVLIFEKDLGCRSLTPDAARLLNLASPAIGRPLDELLAGFPGADVRRRVVEVLETLSPQEFDLQDRTGHWYGVRIRPYRTLDNRIDGVALAIRDIDPLKSATLRLEAAREAADAIVAAVPIPLLVLDADRRVASANPAFLRTFEVGDLQVPIPLDRLAGGDWDIPQLRTHLDGLASEAGTLNDLVLEHEFRTCGKKELRVNGRRLPGPSPGGPMTLLAIEDVTAASDAQRKLVSAMERAESANRAKSDFLANMSHEIRTPLTAILGFTDLLSARDPSTAAPDHPLGKIRRNARHLAALIDDILDLSKIEAGRLEVDVTSFALVPLLSEELAALRVRALERGLAFEVRFDGPVPETIASCSTRLRQILSNVVGNAIKFTDSGKVGVTVRLEPAASAPGRKLAFVVRDTGCGITAEQRPNLFRAFGQADGSVARKYGGSGLGLNLSRRLAQALGGDLVLTDSRPGEGSTFTITIDPGDLAGSRMLSDLDGSSVLSPVEPRTRQAPANARLAEGLRVLLAEDNPDNRELISLFLETSGASVDFAVNGEQAVRMAAERPYDVVLMDVQMPIVDGYEATRRIRQSGNATPIVALTAHAMSGEMDRCRAAGCDGYLSKPVDFASLIDAVAEHGRRKAGPG